MGYHSHKNLLNAYFLRERIRLTNDVRQLQHNIRYRNVDDIDCHELMIAFIRLQDFEEFERNVRALLKIEECDKND